MEGAAKLYSPEGAAHADKNQGFNLYDVEGFYGYRRTRLRAFLLLWKSLPKELFTLLAQLNFDKWKAGFPKLYRHNRQASDAMVPERLKAIHAFYIKCAERLRGICYPRGAIKALVAEMKSRGLAPIALCE